MKLITLLKIFIIPFISIISFIMWFIEISIKGWAGLDWIDYFFVTIPISISVFLITIAILSYKELKMKSIPYVLIIGIVICILYYIYIFLLKEDLYIWINYALIVLPLFIAISFYFIRVLFNLRTPIYVPIISIILMELSIPFGLLINFLLFGNQYGTLTILSHSAPNDIIHIIKTGSIILLFEIGAGVPFIYDQIKKT